MVDSRHLAARPLGALLFALGAALAAALGSAADPAASQASAAALIPADAARVLDEVRRPGARAVLVNIWATWCQPCREELPDLLTLHRAYARRGLRLVLVSGDFESEAEAVARTLSGLGVDFPSFLKQGNDMEFITGLDPRWSGALPATFVYDAGGMLRHFWEGRADYATLERRLIEVLGGPGLPAPLRENP